MTARETNLVNAFETTLAAQLASGGTTMNLTDDPGIDSPVYFVIDPDNDSNREVVLWSSGTNHAAATVTRDIDSKHGTDPTHAAGTQVRLAVVKQHIEEAHDAIQQGFVLEDGDGTEVTIAPAVASGVYTQREVKFIDSGGLDINWTDTDAGTDGDPYDLTFTLDLNGLTAATVNIANDSIAIIDADDSNLTRKESLADVIAAIDGTGLTASSGVLSVDSSQAITALTGGDLTIFDDTNNADVSLKIGTSATEALSIEVLNGASNKTAEEIKISTSTASGTANHGKISIYIDDTEILDIDDGGIDLASGKTFAIDGTDLPTTSFTAGNLIDFDGTDIDVDLSEAAEAAIADGDYILFLDGGATGTAAKEALADVATLFAGTGLSAASSVISVNLNGVSAGTVAQAADSIVFIDADDNATKKESIADFVDAIDGAGLDASSGTLVNAAIGKQSMWVPAAAMYPTQSNGCAAITGVETTAGRPDMYVLDFDASSDENAQFSIAMPSYWNEGTITYQVYWTTAATDTDGVAWALSGVVCSDNDTIDAAFGTAVVVTDDALGAAEDLCVSAESGAVTIAGTPAAGDLAYFNIMRDVSDANDDMAEDARLIGVKIFYTVDDVHEA
mgnify:FL=1